MTELTKNFEPAAVETKWYTHWMEKKYFNSKVDHSRKPFTIVIPPPNVTGVLHMGHTLNETVQDILVRRARMNGFNACWVPGSDHASIATEAKVIAMLKEKGISKKELSRKEFLKYAFEWKEKYGGIIYNQLERLGCSVDWERTTFTMDDHYYEAVIKVFVDLFNKGLIYRGARMINWDPAAKTALSDEEVEHKELAGKLYYLRYRLDTPMEEYITIATQRPETIMGDTAICINPNDERFKHLSGVFAFVPLINRRIPLIFDEYVDPAFGTGALKVTPAHDINDYNLGLKYNLEVVDTLNEDGTLSAAAQLFIGLDRFAARKKIILELQEKGFLTKEEEYTTRLGYSQRTGVVVEPRISTQWFVRMKELAKPALKAVMDGQISIHPGDRFQATYKYWMENVKDWCISRQLWWGQQIPAWYDEKGNLFVAETSLEAASLKLRGEGINNPNEADLMACSLMLSRDEDVLDTWFSSWLWPMEVFRGITRPDNEEIKYFYPGSVLVTGQDIIFFWVARMVMAGLEYEQQIPFKDVYFTGMVRDKLGRKMSKQLGNSPELLELIDKYGADAVRFGIMISSPAGNDLLFDEGSLEQGRNFNNKIWNALKLVQMWALRIAPEELKTIGKMEPGQNSFAMEWLSNRFNQVVTEVNGMMEHFRLSEALKTIYSLIWDDFCSWYLEWIKPGFDEPVDAAVYQATVDIFEKLLQLLHPFMPFVTEEIYHLLKDQKEDLCVKQFTATTAFSQPILNAGQLLKQVISSIRDGRNKNQVKPKEAIGLFIQTDSPERYGSIEGILCKQVNADAVAFTMEPMVNSIVITVEKDKFYITTEKELDIDTIREDLQKDLQHQLGFLSTVEKKLANERFVQNAKPEVLALEQRKKADVLARIKTIEESLSSL